MARVEALESVGLGLAALDKRDHRILVAEITGRFLAPAVGGDRLEVTTEVVEVGRATHCWHQRIERDGEVLFTLDVRAAMTNSAGRPVRVPDFVREALEESSAS